ncbi:LysR family transcriptional regulator [Mesorhizobium australafricanum]|uniref:LysR substrate-binding domain-containing protein n=1 Tax=Mesorhizobium australafricanum TaxID=3072311 RepID=A0ABU4X7K0_9HYPH|nr:LysR substrate-binding domain-containing protein [Mesorhizobium sp. VK3E]MDX8443049.1 LysR substrate-binding domain-containing protein [Mesorhizobium sp. VK3E]
MSNNITLRHLRAFVAVAEHGGYTAAANSLNIAQSALSRTIVEIEEQLDTRLFERTTRRVVLTASGEQLLMNARRVLEEFDGGLSRFQLYHRGLNGVVSLAALSSVASIILPAVISEFRKDRPNVRISVKDGFAEEVVRYVSNGQVDFGITSFPKTKGRLVCERIAADRLICICSKSHRFADMGTVSWSDLAGEDFVAFDPLSSIRACVDRALQIAEIQLGAVTEVRDAGAVAGLVSADLGVSAVPSLVLPMMQFCEFAQKKLVDPVVEREIYLIHDPWAPMPPAAGILMEMLRQGGMQGFRIPTGARWTNKSVPDPPNKK